MQAESTGGAASQGCTWAVALARVSAVHLLAQHIVLNPPASSASLRFLTGLIAEEPKKVVLQATNSAEPWHNEFKCACGALHKISNLSI
jgi:hypothetical protein